MSVRESGILMHLTSLPGPHGIGGMGPEAYRFARFLSAAGQSVWQVLPLNPTTAAGAFSPYHSVSAFAGNPLLISPELMVEEGFLRAEEVQPLRPSSTQRPPEPGRVDFAAVAGHKNLLLERAFERFETDGADHGALRAFEAFRRRHEGWLKDYALFMALKEDNGGRCWNEWPEPLRDRQAEALREAGRRLAHSVRRHEFRQFLFFSQWSKLKEFCNRRSIRIFGDLPIYMPLDSADVWANQQQYKLDDERRPAKLSGVPPDYFSNRGQLWGHPVYRWDVLRQNGYRWWLERLRHNFELMDVVRIDHFRGLVAFWEVDAGASDAVDGRWMPVPCEDFFQHVFRRFGRPPLVAEDLGTITADVREQIRRLGFPGMRVLQFAFGDDFPRGSFLPHNHERNCVVYTGTHDNNTVRGWFDHELDRGGRMKLFRYLGRKVRAEDVHRELIRLGMLSVAGTVIIPMQDVIGLGAEARMNHPAGASSNWQWRLAPGQMSVDQGRWLLYITRVSQRTSSS